MEKQKSAQPAKPLHKDPSFWIVVVVVIGTLNVLQFNYVVPWIKQRAQAAKPAPTGQLMAGGQPLGNYAMNQQEANLDNSKKTYPWQTPRFTGMNNFQSLPPQVVIIPSEYTAPSGGWSTWSPNYAVGIRVPVRSIVQAAYRPANGAGRNANRIIFPPDLPPGEFDFFSNQANATESLQKEIQNKWGLIGVTETRDTNVIILRVDHSDAPGLKPGTPRVAGQQPQQNQPNVIHWQNARITIALNYLENVLNRPVLDETGLTGTYDITLPQMPMQQPYRIVNGALVADATSADAANRLDSAAKILNDQLGLKMVLTNAPVEYMVIKKAGL